MPQTDQIVVGTAINLLVAQGVIPPVFLQFPSPEPTDPVELGLEENSTLQIVGDSSFTFDETPGAGGEGGEVDGDPQQLWIQNAAIVWVPIMSILAIMASKYS